MRRIRRAHGVPVALVLAGFGCAAWGDEPPAVDADQASAPASPMPVITVSAERLNLIGTAATASQGVVVSDELALTPVFRPGELLETIPGLSVTASNAAEFWYIDRPPGEPAEGVPDMHIHPLEPRAVRLTAAKMFD